MVMLIHQRGHRDVEEEIVDDLHLVCVLVALLGHCVEPGDHLLGQSLDEIIHTIKSLGKKRSGVERRGMG